MAGGGAPVNVDRHGSGRRAVLGLHGWGGNLGAFLPLVPLLPDTHSLHCADLPGYNASPPPARWTVEAIVDEIVDAARAIEADELTLAGNCSGGILALLAGAGLGRAVARYVLVDPFAYIPWYFRVFTAPGWGRAAYRMTFANPAGRWITNLSLRGRRSAETDLTAAFRSVDHEVNLRYLELFARLGGARISDADGATMGGLRCLRAPIDIVHGERTFSAIRRSVDHWRTVWPHARVHVLPGAGHLSIREAPERVAGILFS